MLGLLDVSDHVEPERRSPNAVQHSWVDLPSPWIYGGYERTRASDFLD